ncbi:MAG TPA: hypothetical protein VHZ50_18110 [Puia sp.]|jgi:hypothetical protein|nr:hypothetical protein [Puia sp.]
MSDTNSNNPQVLIEVIKYVGSFVVGAVSFFFKEKFQGDCGLSDLQIFNFNFVRNNIHDNKFILCFLYIIRSLLSFSLDKKEYLIIYENGG